MDRNSPDSSKHNEPPKNNRARLSQKKNKHDMLKYEDSSQNLISERRAIQSIKLPKDESGHSNNLLDMDSLIGTKSSDVRQAEPVKNVKVFIIDDSELSRKLMKRLFEQKCDNMKLYEAEDGLDAILKLNGRINSVNLILLDNIMPNITGVLLSKILRGIGYKGMIFGITGNGLDADREEFLTAGANYVFTKPFNMEKFNQMMYFIQNNGYETVPNGKIVETEAGKLVWAI
jgi:CheY-like chemotaxis protein